MDGQILAGLISKSKNPADFKIVGEVLSVEPIAIMYRKDDPGFKKAVDDSIAAMIKSGEVAKLYDKWFMQPIPPSNTKVGLPPSDATKAAWANPNDKPVEDYAEEVSQRPPEVSPSAVRPELAYAAAARRGAIRVALVLAPDAAKTAGEAALSSKWDWQVFLQDTGGGRDLPRLDVLGLGLDAVGLGRLASSSRCSSAR